MSDMETPTGLDTLAELLAVMDQLIAFLRNALDEDERVARAAQANDPSPWRNRALLDSTGYAEGRIIDSNGYTVVHVEAQTPGPETAEHIARWDPARGLAEVEAKRDLIGHIEGLTMAGVLRGPAWALTALKLLARPYASRDGWRENWAA